MRNSKNRPNSENGLAEDGPPNIDVSPSLNDGDADDSLPEAPADVSLGWGQPHRFAILRADGLSGGPPPPPEAWDAGAINVLAADGPIAIAGARSSGVWLINPEYDAMPQTGNFPAQSLSYSWEYTRTSALEWGPEKPRFLFAATSSPYKMSLSLIELKVGLGRLEYVDQRWVPCHAGMGSIRGLTFLEGPRVLVAATEQGLWWTSVPLNPQSTSLYKWQRSTEGLSVEEFSCISPIKDGLSVAAAGVTRRGVVLPTVVENGIFCGSWTGNDFTFSKSTMPKSVQINECRITCCAGNRTTAYAVTTDNNNEGIGAVLRSETGGATWELATIPAGHGGAGSYNMCIAAHPSDRQVVVLGWQIGVFVSTNRGDGWDLRRAPHKDQHALTFSERAPGEFSLFVASDGGLALSSDLGISWDTRYNKHLLNIEIYAPNYARPTGFETTPFDASNEIQGLIACATQDNGNLWCPLDDLSADTFPPWDAFRRADGGDGATSLLLADQTGLWVIAAISGTDYPRSSQFKSTAPRFFEAGSQVVPVSGSSSSLQNPLALARSRIAGLERNGEQLLAVAGKKRQLYGLWRAPGQLGTFALVGEIAADVASVATYDGTQVLAGSKDGRIFLCDTKGGTVVQQPTDSNATDAITRILWATPDIRFAINGNGRVIRWDGTQWEILAKGPSRSVYALEFVPDFAGGVLFASTICGVLGSQDRGETWFRASDGLPRCSFGTNLRLARSRGRNYLYLSTYGWGVFRADVTPRRSVQIRIPRHDLIRKLLPIVEERRGIKIIDGDIVPVEHSLPAYQLAVTILVSSLVQDAFDTNGDQAKELRAASHDLLQRLARKEL
jgi:WD40 repeat protein